MIDGRLTDYSISQDKQMTKKNTVIVDIDSSVETKEAISIPCRRVNRYDRDSYIRIECEFNITDRKVRDEALSAIVTAFQVSRSALHSFHLKGKVDETFDGYILNFSPLKVVLVEHKAKDQEAEK
jgi:hypothetical protein